MIEFQCKNCGQIFRVQDVLRGKKCHCPKCNKLQIVPGKASPADEGSGMDIQHTNTDRRDEGSKKELLNPDIFDVTDQEQRKAAEQKSTEGIFGLPPARGDESKTGEFLPQRKFPLIIDIFLYPISTPGLVLLGIFVGVPMCISFLAGLLGRFSFFISIPGGVINAVVFLYFYWYFCLCVRDSAAGNIRAPDVLVESPSLGDMFFQMLKVLSCLAFFIAPLIIYFQSTSKLDFIFWLLCGYAFLFYPMGLLAVIMYDSIEGLKPFLIIRSIIATFFQYSGILIAWLLVAGLYIFRFINPFSLPFLGIFLEVGVIYFLLVMAHLLGRFYWRNSNKLKWEV
jgi:predicted  nucleic acid-binding Zn-ribbon protein